MLTASFGGSLAFTRQDGAQVFTLDEFHRDELHAVGFVQVVNADDVAMRDLSRQHQFLLESRQNRRIARQIGPNDLQPDGAVNLQVVRFVHRTHAAHAKQFLDFVAAAEDGADLQNGRADGGINRTGRAGTGVARSSESATIVASLEESRFTGGAGELGVIGLGEPEFRHA